MNTPNDDAPQLLKDRWLARAFEEAERKLAARLSSHLRESYTRAEILGLIKTAHRAVREDLALEEATK
jgi:hypothetical protein